MFSQYGCEGDWILQTELRCERDNEFGSIPVYSFISVSSEENMRSRPDASPLEKTDFQITRVKKLEVQLFIDNFRPLISKST